MTARRVLWLMKGLGLGGAERLLVTMAPLIDRQRYELEVAYVLPWKDALVPTLRQRDVAVHCVGAGRRGVRWVSALAGLIHRGGYSAVHTHAPVPAVVARGVPGRRIYIHTEHNTWDRYRLPTRLTNAATLGRNAAVIAVSRGVAASMRKPVWATWARMPQVHVVHHGVDLQGVRHGVKARAEARDTLNLSETTPVIGTVGNLAPKKDQATLIAAFAHLHRRMPDARLVIIGTGPLQEQLRARARSEGVQHSVMFTGSRTDVQRLLPAFDVFALSSLHEGLSIALLEAMAASLPCVATRVGGIPEAVQNGEQGFLVPAGDVSALSAAIEKLLRNPALRCGMGAAGKQRSAQFSIEAAVRTTETIYDTALALA